LDCVCKFRCYQARHLSEILLQIQKIRKKKKEEKRKGKRIRTTKDNKMLE